jgi:hypothetical protein
MKVGIHCSPHDCTVRKLRGVIAYNYITVFCIRFIQNAKHSCLYTWATDEGAAVLLVLSAVENKISGR